LSFQHDAGAQGRKFEQAVETLFLIDGFIIKERRWKHPVCNVEIDHVVWRDDVGDVWVECKGSWLSASGRNGLRRTDTLKKAIANAALLEMVEERRPYWLVTSHLPPIGSTGDSWLRMVVGALFDRVIEVGIAPLPLPAVIQRGEQP